MTKFMMKSSSKADLMRMKRHSLSVSASRIKAKVSDTSLCSITKASATHISDAE